MKKEIKYICCFLLVGLSFISCNYLDIMPNEVATEKDAFANPKAAEKYLYSCYGYLPQANNVPNSLDFTGDETISPFAGELYVKFAEGNYDAKETIISYWNTLFQGIRQCYLLKENIYSVPGLDKSVADSYVAQADFLIAYFHMILIKCYGPTVLIKETPKFDTPKENLLGRTPYDECIDWVADLFDDAAARLPETREGMQYGLATSTAAKALKARMLLYAASPLFNGNPDYNDFKNYDGTPFMDATYRPEKWKRAADAALEAIQLAEKNYELYYMDPGNYASTLPVPRDPTVRSLRFSFMDKDNCREVIFAETRKATQTGIQRKSIPWLKGGGWNGIAPTITMIERFYTKNGLPIEEDKEFPYQDRYSLKVIPQGWEFGDPGKSTLVMHFDREPRFYSWVAFQNGYYECLTESEKDAYGSNFGAKREGGKQWVTGFLKTENCGLYDNRNNNYSKTGYLNKKGVHPGQAAAESGKANNNEYPWPVMRLAELYLDYAEACVQYDKEGYPAKGMYYLDLVRKRAGLGTILESWTPEKAKQPITSYADGQGGENGPLTKIVRQERMIELYLENHNFWDLRRWKMGEFLNTPVRGLNIDAKTLTDFVQVITLTDQRKFDAPRQYLMPIPIGEITKNPHMIQNPKY